MRSFKIAALIACTVISATAMAQTQTDTLKVAGNCGSCEKHIEAAAHKAGASKASWNKDTKILVVTYNASKTSNDAIQKSIADAGYDTPKYAGDEKAYKKLDECCQYDNKRAK